jgi:hypothetical protein
MQRRSIYLRKKGLKRRHFGTAALAAVLLLLSSVAGAQSPLVWILRLAAAAVSHTTPPAGSRSEIYKRLADDNNFESIPRRSGQRFIVVVDEAKFQTVLSSVSFKMPVLFTNDAFSRIPEPFAREITSKCPDAWAGVEIISATSSEEAFRLACGLNFSEETQSPTLSRTPSRPGELEGGRKTHRVQSIEAEIEAIEISNQHDVRITLKVTNVDPLGLNIAIAQNALYSDGIADFWKFNPISDAVLTDNAGNRYSAIQTSGLPFARTSDDFSLVKFGERAVMNLSFSGATQRPGASFNLELGLQLWHYPNGASSPPQHRRVLMRLTDIRPRRD